MTTARYGTRAVELPAMVEDPKTGRYRVRGGSVTTELRNREAVGRTATALPTEGPPVLSPAPAPPYRSKLEAEYAQHLDVYKYAKEIRTWVYEPIKLKLADHTFFSPDFFIVATDGRLLFHEVKGFMRDDAAVKLKVAAKLFPWFEFWLVRKVKGQWEAKCLST